MHVTASWGGAEVVVEVGEECRTLAVLKTTLCAALPECVDVDKLCVEVGERAMEEEDVIALEEGSRVEVVPTRAARALDTLRREGQRCDSLALVEAAEADDVRLCELLLDAGVSWEGEATLLHCACCQDNVALCTLALDHGDDVNAQDDAALHIVARQKNLELCTLLLDRGADVNAVDYRNFSVLHYAVRSKYADDDDCYLLGDPEPPVRVEVPQDSIDMCKLLLDRGCNVNARCEGKLTPLHHAVQTKNIELCALLIDRGADVKARCPYNLTAHCYARRLGNLPELCSLLAKTATKAATGTA
eukprot:Rhum_TRINITY_DN13514_c0_g1::Rhum_TRINITY_DN13514_c0_g1_i1::g.60852::m.60852